MPQRVRAKPSPWFGLLVVAGLGCGRDSAPSAGRTAAVAAAGQVSDRAGSSTPNAASGLGPAPVGAPGSAGCRAPAPLRIRSKGRVVALGDVHGDLAAARAALQAAGAVDATGRWSGGSLTVVQTGDILDRGDDEQALLDWFEVLETQATAAGGQFIWLLGNHELMNAAGDFRYVTPGGFRDFADAPGVDVRQRALASVPERLRARVAALVPGAPYARVMAGQRVIVIVDDVVYAHAGVIGPWPKQADATNRDADCWLAGGIAEPPAAVIAEDGPVWTRALGGSSVDCAQVAAALSELGAARMVVGHTVQPTGITSACEGKVWRIDVGMARAYGGMIAALRLDSQQAPQVIVAERPPAE